MSFSLIFNYQFILSGSKDSFITPPYWLILRCKVVILNYVSTLTYYLILSFLKQLIIAIFDFIIFRTVLLTYAALIFTVNLGCMLLLTIISSLFISSRIVFIKVIPQRTVRVDWPPFFF